MIAAIIGVGLALAALALRGFALLRVDINRLDDKIERLRRNEITHLEKQLLEVCERLARLEAKHG